MVGGSLPRADQFCVAPNSVDTWTVPMRTTGPVIEELTQSLSCDERGRALRFHAEEHQRSFVVGRGILRAILASYILCKPEALVFQYGPKGKPYLENHPGVHFNLGHSGNRAVYAIANIEIGVDVELIKPVPDWQKISERFFSRREVEELTMLNPAQQPGGFFACWTRKEAYIKATGAGLAAGLNKFYVGADPSHREGAIDTDIDKDVRAPRWYFKDLEVGDQYAGALVTRFEKCNIRPFNFERTEDCVRFARQREQPG
ncbi:MAG: 4'-phosphopantetheinyl transferase family protein [Terriglobales bacterium]